MRRSPTCGKCGDLKKVLQSGRLRCTRCYNERFREYYHRSADRRNWQRAFYLKDKYGSSLGEVTHLLAMQGERCAICRRHWRHCQAKKRSREQTMFLQHLYVDHDHESGRVRGLLCNNCNQGIGLFAEDVQRCVNAIRYLNKYKNAA